jgi:hypothetical protein
MEDGSDGACSVGKPPRDAQDSKVAVTVIRTLLPSESEIGHSGSTSSTASWTPAGVETRRHAVRNELGAADPEPIALPPSREIVAVTAERCSSCRLAVAVALSAIA